MIKSSLFQHVGHMAQLSYITAYIPIPYYPRKIR